MGKEANILPKCYVCLALHTGINLALKFMETGSSGGLLQDGDLNLYVLLKMGGEKQGLCCVPLNEWGFCPVICGAVKPSVGRAVGSL